MLGFSSFEKTIEAQRNKILLDKMVAYSKSHPELSYDPEQKKFVPNSEAEPPAVLNPYTLDTLPPTNKAPSANYLPFLAIGAAVLVFFLKKKK